MTSGVATRISKSILPAFTSLIISSRPTRSAPAFFASSNFSGVVITAIFIDLAIG